MDESVQITIDHRFARYDLGGKGSVLIQWPSRLTTEEYLEFEALLGIVMRTAKRFVTDPEPLALEPEPDQ